MPLPPGVSQERFNEACRRFGRVVGDEWVLTSEADIRTYRDPYSPFLGDETEEYVPSGAVAPKAVEEVQEVVRIANEFLIPFWPVSTGRNLGYGGPAPRQSGTMVLDLKRMNRVLEVNETLAYALVEPGVSYFDLYRHIRERKLKVWLDCADPGWGSLIGNAMDHGVGRTTHRDHFDCHCGMEVVLPDGELLRTGAGSIPNSPVWNTFKYGFGPHISPMFGQANFGVVTKMGFWLLPEQQVARFYRLEVPLYENVTPFLETMMHLVCSRIIDGSWGIGTSIRQSEDAEIRAAVQRGVSDEELGRLGARKGIGFWNATVKFYGPPGVIDAKHAYVRETLAAISGATTRLLAEYRFPLDPDTVDESVISTAKADLGIPEMTLFAGLGRGRAYGHLFFAPIIPATGPELLRANRVFREAYVEMGLPPPATRGGSCWFDRNIVLLYAMNVSADPAVNRVTREHFKRLVQVAAANGWGEYRTPPAFMDEVMAAQSFNNHALRRFLEKVKDTVDPNGILAPGRSGIWPKRMRRA